MTNYEHVETYWMLTLPGEWPTQTRVEETDLPATLADLRGRYSVKRKTFSLDDYALTLGAHGPHNYVGEAHLDGHLNRRDVYRRV